MTTVVWKMNGIYEGVRGVYRVEERLGGSYYLLFTTGLGTESFVGKADSRSVAISRCVMLAKKEGGAL